MLKNVIFHYSSKMLHQNSVYAELKHGIMKQLFLLTLIATGIYHSAFSQNGFPNYYAYQALYAKADSLFQLKEYAKAAEYYSQAAEVKVEKAFGYDYADTHFNAARSYMLAGKSKQALEHLNLLATQCKYTEYDTLVSEAAFKTLAGNKNWQTITALVKNNKTLKKKNFIKILLILLWKKFSF